MGVAVTLVPLAVAVGGTNIVVAAFAPALPGIPEAFGLLLFMDLPGGLPLLLAVACAVPFPGKRRGLEPDGQRKHADETKEDGNR